MRGHPTGAFDRRQCDGRPDLDQGHRPTPIAGKGSFSIDREWREELIYFTRVDRVQDGVVRPVTAVQAIDRDQHAEQIFTAAL